MAKLRSLPEHPPRPFYDEADFHYPNPYIDRTVREYGSLLVHPLQAIEQRGRWAEFTGGAPLEAEIGCGRGRFLTQYAMRHPDIRLIGLEIKFKRIYKIATTLHKQGSVNAALLRFDAQYLDHIFAPGELSAVHLYFPDPWYKKERHQHHRLVAPRCLSQVFQCLKPGCCLHYKTDHQAVFEEALTLLPSLGFEIDRQITDLQQSPWAAGNIETEFESTFKKLGISCQYLRAKRPA